MSGAAGDGCEVMAASPEPICENRSSCDKNKSIMGAEEVASEGADSSSLPSSPTGTSSSNHSSTDQSGEEVNYHRLLEQCSLLIEEYTIRSDNISFRSDEVTFRCDGISSSLESSSSSYSSDYSSEGSFTDTESLEGTQFDYENPSRHLYDAHLPLIQFIDFNPVVSNEEPSVSEGSNSEDVADEEKLPCPDAEDISHVNSEATSESHPVVALSPQVSVDSGEHKICIQCCAWPEVQKNKDQPVHYCSDCHHLPSSPLECAFGGTNNHLTLALTDADKDPDTIEKRQNLESALKSIFFLLITQFEDNPGDIARLLYGISIIDLQDLNVATSFSISLLNRAEILAVTLVRRLRQTPDSFEDVCKVLKHIPALQIANEKLLCPTLEQSMSLLETISEISEGEKPVTSDSIPDLQHDSEMDSLVFSQSSSIDPDIIAEDAVSHGSRLSINSTHVSEPEPQHMCKPKKNHLLLHQTCLVSRSTKSLDALLATEELDINTRDQNGRTPLLISCLCLPSDTPNLRVTKKQREKIKCLVKNGADITIQDYDGNTPLHISALRRDSEVLSILLQKDLTTKLYISIPNKNGRTALHYACFWGDLELILPLLETEKEQKSGLVNIQDRNGDTGLHIASRRGYKKAVKELLKANANKDLKNMEGKTAADVARENKNYKIAKKLDKTKSLWHFSRRKGASVDDQAANMEMGRSRYSSSPPFYDSQDGMSSQEEESDLEDDEEMGSRVIDSIYD